jgi:hypothetical protein
VGVRFKPQIDFPCSGSALQHKRLKKRKQNPNVKKMPDENKTNKKREE